MGSGSIPLYGQWKFHVGDSPVDQATHTLIWADPKFDDSNWEIVDMAPQPNMAIIPGEVGYVPGWGAFGHSGYWGFGWYRLRIQIEARPGTQLALQGPTDVDDAYQVFANERLLGSFGDFSAKRPSTYQTQPMMFPFQLSTEAAADPLSQGLASVTLAFRVWMDPRTGGDPNAGGIHSTPELGESQTIKEAYQARWAGLLRGYAAVLFETFLFSLLAIFSVSLIFFDRSDRIYLWMGIAFFLSALSTASLALCSLTQSFSLESSNKLGDVIGPLYYLVWVRVWWAWFQLQRPSWIPRAATGLAAISLLCNLIGNEFLTSVDFPKIASSIQLVSLAVRLGIVVLSIWIVFIGVREYGVEGWLVLPGVLLWSLARLNPEIVSLLHIRTFWFPFGFFIQIGDIAQLLLTMTVAILLFRRLLFSVRRQKQIALDVKQAQEVQQVILPEPLTELPGFVIESEYRPAREVGGDFFQIIPQKGAGSLLVVAGDVTGKGLRAGMLVALLVGSIRTAAQFDTDPRAILDVLNQRLIGRGEAQATCLALRIDMDGTAILANAGHMAPYLNREQIEMEGSLPLGMIEGADFSVIRFMLASGDRLILMSDGIVEAMDANGELFGFERLHDLMRKAASALEVSRAAQQFGQEDDISVITITRTRELTSSLA